jgi:methyltransferase (TIGR00027 family)
VTELPSRTSIWAAGARAVGSRIKHPHWHNPDHLADKLIGAEERALIGEHPLAAALLRDTAEIRENPEVQSSVMTLIVRTKFIDERLKKAIAEGATQVVIMGAGWDTRAHRFSDLLRDARVFEVDQPATQNWKRRRVAQVIGPDPKNLTYLPIDFRHQTLADVLATAGYDPKQETFFIWEGVTMYLPEAAVRDTLRWIAQQAPGSSVVFDFAYRGLIDVIAQMNKSDWEPPNEAARVGAARIRMITAWGEPWIFGIPTDGSSTFLNELGLEHRETLSMSSTEAARRYLGWDSEQPFPASIRQFYAIAEAAVRG